MWDLFIRQTANSKQRKLLKTELHDYCEVHQKTLRFEQEFYKMCH